jgi:hypothetical protein
VRVGVHIGRFKIPVCCRVHIYVTYRGGVAHAPPTHARVGAFVGIMRGYVLGM